MVVYEIISGNLPFHKHADLTVAMKVLEGEHPPRGMRFTEELWKMLEQCWVSQPNNRPSIEDVRQCLETSSNLLEVPSPEADVGVEDDGDGWDSENSSPGAPNETIGTTMIKGSITMSPSMNYFAHHLLREGIDRPGHEPAGPAPPIPRIDSSNRDTYQVTAIQLYIPPARITHRRTRPLFLK